MMGTSFYRAYGIARCLHAFGSILEYCINSTSIRTASSGHVNEIVAIGRCPFREVPMSFLLVQLGLEHHFWGVTLR